MISPGPRLEPLTGLNHARYAHSHARDTHLASAPGTGASAEDTLGPVDSEPDPFSGATKINVNNVSGHDNYFFRFSSHAFCAPSPVRFRSASTNRHVRRGLSFWLCCHRSTGSARPSILLYFGLTFLYSCASLSVRFIAWRSPGAPQDPRPLLKARRHHRLPPRRHRRR